MPLLQISFKMNGSPGFLSFFKTSPPTLRAPRPRTCMQAVFSVQSGPSFQLTALKNPDEICSVIIFFHGKSQRTLASPASKSIDLPEKGKNLASRLSILGPWEKEKNSTMCVFFWMMERQRS